MQKKYPAFLKGFIALLLLLSVTNISFANTASQDKFIQFIQTQAQQSNAEILATRIQLLKTYHNFISEREITAEQEAWLTKLAKQYKVTDPDFTHQTTWQLLLQRVDLIPVSLVVAQAINESSWGTSRFAKQGNNYFGQWCYSKGCGLLPEQRAENAEFEVRRFASPIESVRSYMLNLNTLHLYHDFRTRRHVIRLSGRPLTGLQLVSTLRMYSIRRGDYVDSIIQIIDQYHLAKLDRQQVLQNPTHPESHKIAEASATEHAHTHTHTHAHVHAATTSSDPKKAHWLDGAHETENTKAPE